MIGVSTGIRAARGPFTSAHVPSWIVRNLILWIKSGSFRFSVDWHILVALDFASILRCLFASRVDPWLLRVWRLRLNHSEGVNIERPNVAQSRISDRRVFSR